MIGQDCQLNVINSNIMNFIQRQRPQSPLSLLQSTSFPLKRSHSTLPISRKPAHKNLRPQSKIKSKSKSRSKSQKQVKKTKQKTKKDPESVGKKGKLHKQTLKCTPKKQKSQFNSQFGSSIKKTPVDQIHFLREQQQRIRLQEIYFKKKATALQKMGKEISKHLRRVKHWTFSLLRLFDPVAFQEEAALKFLDKISLLKNQFVMLKVIDMITQKMGFMQDFGQVVTTVKSGLSAGLKSLQEKQLTLKPGQLNSQAKQLKVYFKDRLTQCSILQAKKQHYSSQKRFKAWKYQSEQVPLFTFVNNNQEIQRFIEEQNKQRIAFLQLQMRSMIMRGQIVGSGFAGRLKSDLVSLNHLISLLEQFIKENALWQVQRLLNTNYGSSFYNRWIALKSNKVSGLTLSYERRILPKSLYTEFVQQLNELAMAPTEFQKHFYRAIYDCFDQHLNQYRPYYQVGGEPCPWSVNQRIHTCINVNQKNFGEVLEETKSKVILDCSQLCGPLIELDQFDSQSLVSQAGEFRIPCSKYPELNKKVNERLEKMLTKEAFKGWAWLDLEDAKSKIALVVSNTLEMQLIREVINEFL